MRRIRNALLRYAPPGVVLTDSPRGADLHILDFVGQHPEIEDRVLHPQTGLMRDIPSLPVCRNYVIIYHCPPPAGPVETAEKEFAELDYRPLFENAKLVIGFRDPAEEGGWGKLDWTKINYFLTPWGYEDHLFFYAGEEKRILCVMTGYVSEPEALREVWAAARIAGGTVVHVGGSIGLDGMEGYMRVEGISDEELRRLYASSLYVNAIRKEGGFELPGIEGAACGAQPIYADLPCYRRWFDDIGLFVDPAEVMEGVARIFTMKVRREGIEEKVRRFEWRKIAPRIWEEVRKAL